jgi:hypothetical protein
MYGVDDLVDDLPGLRRLGRHMGILRKDKYSFTPAPEILARAHGVFNIISGLWPLVHMPSFEKVFGPKADKWLVQTVAGLLLVIGWTQFSDSDAGGRRARRLGVGTSATLLTIDVVYVSSGTLRWTYLLDAVAEAGWLVAWTASDDAQRRVSPAPVPATQSM